MSILSIKGVFQVILIHNWTHLLNEIIIANVIEHTAIKMWKWWIKNLSFFIVEISSIDRLHAMNSKHAMQYACTKTTEKGRIHEYQSRNCNKGCEITLSILWWVVKRRREIWMIGGILWYVGNYANFSFFA